MIQTEDTYIYSPEASDTARFGDWQSKVGAVVWIVAAILAVGALG